MKNSNFGKVSIVLALMLQNYALADSVNVDLIESSTKIANRGGAEQGF